MYHKWRSHGVWLLRYKARQTESFNVLGHFLIFDPPNNQKKNQNLKKHKKNVWRCYHFTLMYNKWRSYDVWFLRYVTWQTYFFLGHFCPFTSLTTWKINILKKEKKTLGDIIVLHLRTKNNGHMIYGSWDMECDRQKCFSFWTYFVLLSP